MQPLSAPHGQKCYQCGHYVFSGDGEVFGRWTYHYCCVDKEPDHKVVVSKVPDNKTIHRICDTFKTDIKSLSVFNIPDLCPSCHTLSLVNTANVCVQCWSHFCNEDAVTELYNSFFLPEPSSETRVAS
jgi:hypothetical protein